MQKISKKLLSLTLLTIFAIGSVSATVILATIYGGTVTVVSVTGTIEYSLTNIETATWTETLTVPINVAWYCRFKTTTSGYAGAIIISWTLQKYDGVNWNDLSYTLTTTISLSGSSGQIVYASTDGLITNNKNWGSHTDQQAQHRIKAVFEKV